MGSVRTALSVPGALPMAVWSVFGRLAFAMVNLSLLIYVEAESGSYAIAGAISAASLVGVALGTVAQSRLIDRYGPTRTLLAFAGPFAVLSAAVIVSIPRGLPLLPLALLVAAQCAMLPTVQVASRSMWPHLLPAGPKRDAAYNYEAISFEMCWLLGPALAGLLATVLWPGSALVAAAVAGTVTAVGFALTRVARSHRGSGSVAADTPDGAADAPGAAGGEADEPGAGRGFHRGGLAILLVAASAFGLTIGFVVVAVTAGTHANGAPQMVSPLLALWSISSMVGGLVYQRRPWPRSRTVRLPVLIAVLGAVLLVPTLLAGVVPLALAVVLAGVTLVPQITLHNTLLDGLVPARRLAEAFGWLTMAIAGANAGGQALGGLVIEGYDYQAGLLAASAGAIGLAGVVFVGRRRLLPARPGQRPGEAARPRQEDSQPIG
ncbi:MFS transporter [Plantactinospora sp. GCM10030261]|uniref:MFS transporter n=1 Tax=Plantactinospora sp. GCM10030261 TaxID=3273420 RepID=UPI00361E41F1